MTPRIGDDTRRLEAVLGRVLGLGVLTSSTCLGVGLVLALSGVAAGFANVILTVGLLALLATPAARVAVSALVYLRERDWLFVMLTLVVLAELAVTVVAAFYGSGR